MPKSSKMASSPPAKKRKRDSGRKGELDQSKEEKGSSCPPIKKRKKDTFVPPPVKKIGEKSKVNGVKVDEVGKEDSCASLSCEPCQKQFNSSTTFKYHAYFCQRTAPSGDRDKIEALLKKSKEIIEARNKANAPVVNGDASAKESKSLKAKSVNHKLKSESTKTENSSELPNGVLVEASEEGFKKPV